MPFIRVVFYSLNYPRPILFFNPIVDVMPVIPILFFLLASLILC